MKIVNFIIELLTSPFVLLFRSNAKPGTNKVVKPLIVLGCALVAVALLIFLVYYEVIFE
jgi:hypothetical protein